MYVVGAIPHLVCLLPHAAHVAASAQGELAAVQSMCEQEIVGAGAVPPLVSNLSGTESMEAQRAASTLSSLAARAEPRMQAIAGASVIEPLGCLVNEDNGKTAEQAKGALKELINGSFAWRWRLLLDLQPCSGGSEWAEQGAEHAISCRRGLCVHQLTAEDTRMPGCESASKPPKISGESFSTISGSSAFQVLRIHLYIYSFLYIHCLDLLYLY